MTRGLGQGFGLVGLGLMLVWACVPEPSTDEPYVSPPGAHDDFPLTAAHLPVDCDACHVAGAAEQGLTSSEPNGWVDAISTECVGCHEDTRQERFAGYHYTPQSCGEAGCHSITHDCWAEVTGGPCAPPPPPPPVTPPPEPTGGHSGELADRFPLEPPHDVGCASCHPASFADQAGGGDRCEDCHARPTPDHYPPYGGATDDGARGCKACHALEVDGVLQVPTLWSTGAVEHVFPVPHGSGSAYRCISCHPTGGQSADGIGCQGACHATLSPIHEQFTGPCQQCHPRGEYP